MLARNSLEYPIVDSLAAWYRIVIASSHTRDWAALSEADASLLHKWWEADTPLDGGDRCIFGSGDDLFNQLLNAVSLEPMTERVALAQAVFGVASAISSGGRAASGIYFYRIEYPNQATAVRRMAILR